MSQPPSGIDPAAFPEPFASQYRAHLQHLQLKGLRPKTIEAYARAMRRIGTHFRFEVSALSPAQLADYFTAMKAQHSWSGVKLDLYGLKFFTEHVLAQPWHMPGFIRAPKTSRLPDIVSVSQAQAIFDHTRCLSYRVFFFTLYSLGLRLGQGLALGVADIDADRMRVQVRNAKGKRDRLVPLPQATLEVLRRFWALHRHPTRCCCPTARRDRPVPTPPTERWTVAACSAPARASPTNSASKKDFSPQPAPQLCHAPD